MKVLQSKVLMAIHPILLLNSGHWILTNNSCNKSTYCLRPHFLSSFKTFKGCKLYRQILDYYWVLGNLDFLLCPGKVQNSAL